MKLLGVLAVFLIVLCFALLILRALGLYNG